MNRNEVLQQMRERLSTHIKELGVLDTRIVEEMLQGYIANLEDILTSRGISGINIDELMYRIRNEIGYINYDPRNKRDAIGEEFSSTNYQDRDNSINSARDDLQAIMNGGQLTSVIEDYLESVRQGITNVMQRYIDSHEDEITLRSGTSLQGVRYILGDGFVNQIVDFLVNDQVSILSENMFKRNS